MSCECWVIQKKRAVISDQSFMMKATSKYSGRMSIDCIAAFVVPE
jgi:hypothetical protein